jgi:integrase/recombinase XerD
MFSNQTGEIYICSMLDKRRANPDGDFPVKIRVTYKRDRIYFVTGKYMSEKEWEALPYSKGQVKQTLKKDIQAIFDNVKNEVIKLNADGSFSFDNLNRQLKKGISETINVAFAAKMEALTKTGQIGTKISYECALHSFESFAGQSIQFQSITIDWLKRYERSLISDGRTYTTIGFYLRCLRAILNDAIRAGVLKQSLYPFGVGRYQIQTGESRKLALSIDQIKTVVNYTDGLEATNRYRDLWYFSLLCNGANFTDVLKLRFSDIRNGEITFIRQKTSRTSKIKKMIIATLSPAMQTIITTYGNPNIAPNSYIFPYLTGHETPTEEKLKVQDIVRRTNKRLAKIGESLGIEGLNTYSARHSYTNILLQGGAPVALIADQLGHLNIKTTQGYLAGFGKDERKKYSDLFKDL